MLRDSHGRTISYLRISVTERCNFRCVYCMPAEGIALLPKDQLLTFEEIARVARAGAGLGLSKIRLTGGEPTVRAELPKLVAMLDTIPGVREVSMTTNGARLAELARPLKASGLSRVNVSLDTLRRDRAAEIARRDVLPDVLRGIDAALDAGLGPLKLNAVVMRGVNDDELCELVAFAHSKHAQMRFIEYMPMGAARFDAHNRMMPAREMLDRLRERFDMAADDEVPGVSHDPARGWRCRRTGARVGFITSISDHFCNTCNRMRLTAEGGLRPCLHQDAEVDVRAILRTAGEGDLEGRLAAALRRAAGLKWAGHHLTALVPLYSRKEMVAIGG